jgi:hypothetical protein
MSNHTHVRLGYTEKPCRFRSGLLVIEGHDDHRALTLLQTRTQRSNDRGPAAERE